MLGLVLSGGGARGAYEAGVMRYVYGDLAPRLSRPLVFDLVCGTSIGALNGAWLAALAAEGARHISDYWRTVTPDAVYQFRAVDLVRVPEKFLRAAGPVERGAAVFDPAPLYAYVRDTMPWGELRSRIDRGDIKAFVVSVTDVANGRSVQFVDGIQKTRETGTMLMQPTRIRPDHCLASAAIPFIFPPVKVDGRYYVDGALRQNTPLAPAIQLGVGRALVIGVKRWKALDARAVDAVAPSPAFLAGKALNALMLDPVEEDIRRVDRVTELLEWSERAYPGYIERMAREFRSYRPIRTVHLRPSEDIGRLAAELFPVCEPDLPWATRMLLRGVAASENPQEADLMSYLLFHHRFTGALEELGYRDAAQREDELAALFDPPAITPPSAPPAPGP
jgi:NTE family protein